MERPWRKVRIRLRSYKIQQQKRHIRKKDATFSSWLTTQAWETWTGFLSLQRKQAEDGVGFLMPHVCNYKVQRTATECPL